MVQVLPPAPPKFSLGGALGTALGEALTAGLQSYEERNQRRKLQEALGRVGDIYGNPELTEQQRLVQAYQQLAGAGRPELGQHLGGQLSRLGVQQEGFRNKILNKQQEQQQFAQSLQNLQDLYADPNLSDEQKVFGVYQELAQNPSLAHNLLGSLEKPRKSQEEDIAGEQFSKGYEAIATGDSKTLNDILRDPQTSHRVKKQLTDLSESSKVRRDVANKELRNRQSFVARSYQQALNMEHNRLKSEPLSRDERTQIKKRIANIESSMKKDLRQLAKDPNAYPDLSLWNMFQQEGAPEEFQEASQVVFDANNPEHRMEAAKLFQQFGDKEKVREILRRKYKGL